MRVLHVEFGRHLYGGALQVAYLLRGLAEHPEVENEVVVPMETPLPEAVPVRPGVRFHRIPIAGELDVRIFWRLKRLVKSQRPDLIHIHSRRGADFWGVLLARWSGIPYIVTRRVVYPEARCLIRWRTRKAVAVVGISGRVCEMMGEAGVPAGKTHCILSTVDTAVYRPGREPDWFRAEMRLGTGDLAVGMIGQLIEGKGHRVLFEAIPAILEACPEAVFLLFGKGHLGERLRSHVERQPWRERVRFMGFRTDMARVIPNLDLVVHPAFMEGLGVSLLQAAACAVPIVGSNAGGIPEIIKDGRNGYLIEPGDSKRLSESTIRLLRDPALRTQMGENGRVLTEACFSIHRMAADYARLYADCLHPPSRERQAT
jgi:glycosyltransferase involved in cell wall biosynthesis